MSEGPATDAGTPTGEKRPYYRPTTADQRKLLFRVYEETGDAKKAAVRAHVGVGTFYYWWSRFKAGGYGALEAPRSHAPQTSPNRLPASVVEEVKAAKREHPVWGRQRIADELRRGHDWHPVVSPSAVRRILIEAGLWSQVARPPKAREPSGMPRSRTRR